MKPDTDFAVTLDAPGYYSLAAVLERAFKQASEGKGKERHANDLPFHEQPMQTIAGAHGVGFLTGQAAKKSQEALGLPHDAKIKELLGAINYLAGAVIFLEARQQMEHETASAVAAVEALPVIEPEMADWIEWKGGPQPVPFNTLVDVKLRSGVVGMRRGASSLNWGQISMVDHRTQVIAYRISTNG